MVCVNSFSTSPTFAKANRATLEATPFDGCTLSPIVDTTRSDSYQYLGFRAFGTTAWSYTLDMAASVSDAKTIGFSKFAHNFIAMEVTPGNIDWGSDNHRRSVVNNFRLAARLCAEAGFKGIWFDPEPYADQLWASATYNKKYSLKTMQGFVKQWGKEIIEGVAKEHPTNVFMHIFGYYPCASLLTPPYNQEPTPGGQYELYADFLDGLYEGVAPEVQLIDGCESAVALTQGYQFDQYRPIFQNPFVRHSKKATERMKMSFPMYLDYQAAPFDAVTDTNNPRSAAAVESITRVATQYSDKYMWVYQGAPLWWGTPDGQHPAMPTVYINAVKNARRALGMNRDS